jgi:hypothetical protein
MESWVRFGRTSGAHLYGTRQRRLAGGLASARSICCGTARTGLKVMSRHESGCGDFIAEMVAYDQFCRIVAA